MKQRSSFMKRTTLIRSASFNLKCYEREMMNVVVFHILAVTAVLVTFCIIIKRLLELCLRINLW
jgi:hypothetical protein